MKLLPTPDYDDAQKRSVNRRRVCTSTIYGDRVGTGGGSALPVYLSLMACKTIQRLYEAYFDAFQRQQRITQRLAELRQSGNEQLIKVAEAQQETEIDAVYGAWQELNRHICSDECRADDHAGAPEASAPLRS